MASRLKNASDVLVIGAGVIGASVAFRLAETGARVTVIERYRPGAGTTQTSFAWINAHNKRPRPYYELNAAGVAEHHALARELQGNWLHATGCLQVAQGSAEVLRLRKIVGRLQEWGYEATLIDGRRAHELEPDLDLRSNAESSYAFFPGEGWVEATVLVHALLHAAVTAGASLVYPAEVTALLAEGNRVCGAETMAETFGADVVVDCTGRDMGALLTQFGLSIKRRISPGLLVTTQPVPTCLSRVVLTTDFNLRPDGVGRVLIQSEAIDAALDPEVTTGPGRQTAAELVEKARGLLPALDQAEIDTVRLGWRAMPGDGLSAVGPLRGIDGYYAAFTHSGITLGPLLGRRVAAEIYGAAPDPLLAGFRPDRLVQSDG